MPPLKPEKPKREFSWSKLSKTVSFWILVILIPFVMLQALGARDNAEREIKYSPMFRDEPAANNIKSVTVQGGKVIVGEFKQRIMVDGKQTGRFRVNLPGEISDELVKDLTDKQVSMGAEESKPSITAWLVNFLPWLILIGFYLFFFPQRPGGGKKGFLFGKVEG